MARDTYRTCGRHCRGISCTITTLGMLLVWVHAGTVHLSHHEAPRDFETDAIWGVFDRSETPSVDTDSARQTVAPPLQAQGTRGISATTSSVGPTRPQMPPASPVAALAETRLALVIGNGSYSEARLRNPLNDARAMEQSLRDVGFEVVKREDLTKRAMEEEIRAFGKRLKRGGVGLFYFAGHGVQINGANYLLPIDSTIEKEQDVEHEAVNAGRVISEMEYAENRLNIVILDACRNNPLTRSFRSAVHGLAAMNAPSGTLIAYATAPGKVAHDGEGDHGLYTQELLQQMRLPGVKLEDLFKSVRVAVKTKSQGKQLPWETSALEGDFFFVKPDPPQAHAGPEESRVDPNNRQPPATMPERESVPPLNITPESMSEGVGPGSPSPVEEVARPQKEAASVPVPKAPQANPKKRPAPAPQTQRGGDGWKIIPK